MANMVIHASDRAERPIRVLLTKFELESHDRGFSLVAQMLRDAGMEVVLTIFRDPSEVVRNAVQEDVDVIGLSAVSGDTHKVFLPVIVNCLEEQDKNEILLIAGGRIVGEDAKILVEQGVSRTFGPGSQPDEIVDYIRKNVVRMRN